MSDDLLVVEGLKKYFPVTRGIIFQKQIAAVQAVDDVSFVVKRGETLGVVGESGCGKSTMARCVARLLDPTDGRIIFDGTDITRLSRTEMRPLSGYPGAAALISVSTAESACMVMLGKRTVSTLRSFRRAASVRRAASSGRSDTTTRSAPNSWLASCPKACFTRSAKNATVVRLATAITSPTPRTRSSPARQSRASSRQDRAAARSQDSSAPLVAARATGPAGSACSAALNGPAFRRRAAAVACNALRAFRRGSPAGAWRGARG